MKTRAIFTFLFLFSAIQFGFSSTAKISPKQTGTWERLGTKTADLRGDHDVITVTASEGLFQQVRFEVRKSALFLKNITIVFGSGADKTVNFNKRIPAGSNSRIIDLPGNKRIIRSIKFNYRSVPNGNGRAVVIAWGKH